MDGHPNRSPKDPSELLALIEQQQRTIASLSKSVASKDKQLARKDKELIKSHDQVQQLEERIRALLISRFGRKSEKFNPDQFQLFNEAELLAAFDTATDNSQDTDITVGAHSRKRKKSPHALPAHLPRVDVEHDLDEDQKQCSCGNTLHKIDEEVLEQLSIIPQQYYVIRHRKAVYACSCKQCMRTAKMPVQPLPRCQVSAQMLCYLMVSKYLDGLPLYRLEKMGKRSAIELPRARLARWLIDGSAVFQPLLNLLIDSFFSYDIAMSDDTGIQVLKEANRAAHSQSALWIRRGGPPDKPVVLVDYAASKSGETAYGLLSEFHGTLVCDGASNFNLSVRRNGLSVALCNDHARRRFRRVYDQLSKEDKATAQGSIAGIGLAKYKKLYQIESEIKELTAEQKHAARQAQALPHWESFIAWAKQVQAEGVRHPGTRDALSYLIKHTESLQTYCHDGRLPISNIKSEHVAKTIAIARKNFMFADTPAGAEASAKMFSMIETARANDHNPQHYLTVLLSELPNISCVEEVEALLPWNLTPEEASHRYHRYPAP